MAFAGKFSNEELQDRLERIGVALGLTGAFSLDDIEKEAYGFSTLRTAAVELVSMANKATTALYALNDERDKLVLALKELAALKAERDKLKAQTELPCSWCMKESRDAEILKLRRSIELICEMVAQLKDPTAMECIQDILHPEER